MVPNDVLLTIVMICRFGRPQMLKRMSVQYGGIDIKKASKVQECACSRMWLLFSAVMFLLCS